MATVSPYGQLKGSLDFDKNIVKMVQDEFRRVAKKRVLNGAFEKDFSAIEESKGGVQEELNH